MELERIYELDSEGVEEIPTDSFDSFHALWRDPLRRALAMATGDGGLAADAIDEAMTRAFVAWEKVGSYEHPEGWVYRVGLNYSRDLFRRRRYELPQQILADAVATQDRVPDLDVIRAVGQLPRKFREVVIARYYLDWSTANTASALGVAEGTVKSRVSRAIERLGELLGDQT